LDLAGEEHVSSELMFSVGTCCSSTSGYC